ncbi:hotdog fold domain-containing protein [Leekyejoonella antrihumi]|uniref:DUF4442 domain-containing protein n=1 Tax=Leekyejoonella antrihumi TaxID=1660198 RepID=A0A563DTQ9_9MICO|nr:hotdog fold domain-containing protein [Leekyejoonella antrihumi]TWP33635.1 DUF4442 domain-containing protein [Leekyejoonella antrihumi]
MTSTLQLYRTLADRPLGRRVFSVGYMLKAPYFASVRPWVVEMGPHRAVVQLHKRRRVQNHLGTMHAIAVANGMEAAMGLLAEATIDPGKRWIPRGIQLDYVAKARGDVRCVAQTDADDWDRLSPHEVRVRVSGALPDGTEVVRGFIPLWITDAR